MATNVWLRVNTAAKIAETPNATREPSSMARHVAALVALVLAPAGALGACVPQAKYDGVLADAQKAHSDLVASQDHEKADEDEIAKTKQALADAQAQVQDRDQKLSDLTTSDHNVQAQLDEATAINAKLRGELERLGKNVDTMLTEKGTLAKALDDAKLRLEELRKAQAAAEARAQLFQQFVQKFKKMVDAGQLKIATRAGRLVLQLSNDVLFDVGQTTLKPAGKDALTQIAQVLRTVQGRSFQVAGNTDNLPIQTARFPSNWELSTARAVEVVKLLVTQHVDARALSAAGYGEFDPVASNDTPDGRAKNRRIEITLQPNLDELVAAPDIK
jgi:chemotaxis protein MotB